MAKLDHTTAYRIPRQDGSWLNPELVEKFFQGRGTYPSAVWEKVMDDCECCDDAHEQPKNVAERCQVREFDFGPKYTFVLYDHKRADGAASLAILDAYQTGRLVGSFTFDQAIKAQLGWLGAYCQAENKMLELLGIPVQGGLLPEVHQDEQGKPVFKRAKFPCKLDKEK